MFTRRGASGCGLLIDIGSGSVGMALCSSDPAAPALWSHREHAPLTVPTSVQASSKAIATAIMNAMLVFESTGRVALSASGTRHKIDYIQVTVAAPWSYTVTRTVTYEKDEPFKITADLLQDLVTGGSEQSMTAVAAEHPAKDLGVTETSRTILDIKANGYRVTTLANQQVQQLAVTHVNTLIRKDILGTLEAMQQKLFPDTTLRVTSSMLVGYYVLNALQPVGVDYCLIDITNEATELGVVRHNTLQYATHVAFGRTSIAREVSAATKVTLHEAFTRMRTLHKQTNLPADVLATLAAYTDQVRLLFQETGDRLTIPRHIYLQVDAGLGDFFSLIVEQAGKAASKNDVLVTIVTPELLAPTIPSAQGDIALLASQTFFHTKGNRTFFEYL